MPEVNNLIQKAVDTSNAKFALEIEMIYDE